MRNLKKFLALVLAMVMAFSLMLSASAATVKYDDFKDTEEVTPEFVEAVKVLTGLEVIKGDGPEENKRFRPQDDITRAEAAALVYRIVTGDINDTQVGLYSDYSNFVDVKPRSATDDGDWFAGYVGYCQNAGIIKGHANRFNPYDKVTGYEVLAMILRAVGYGKDGEFEGANWQVNVASLAKTKHISDSVTSVAYNYTLNMNARREIVAELLFRGSLIPQVTWSSALGYNEHRDIISSASSGYNDSLSYEVFGLWREGWQVIDEWGNPGYIWTAWRNPSNDRNDPRTVATIEAVPSYETHEQVYECDVAHALNDKDLTAWLYVNSKAPVTTTYNIVATDTVTKVGGQGRLTKVYTKEKLAEQSNLYYFNQYWDWGNYWEDGLDERNVVTMVDTFLAKVNGKSDAKLDPADHVIVPAKLDVTIYDGNVKTSDATAATNGSNVYSNKIISKPSTSKVNWDEYSVGDYILIYAYTDQSKLNTHSTDDAKEKAAFETNKVVTSTAKYPSNTLVQGVNVWVQQKADVKQGKQTVTYWNQGKHQIDGQDYPDQLTLFLDKAGNNINTTYNWYFDLYENIIGVAEATGSRYGVITSIYAAVSQGDSDTTGGIKAMATVKFTDGTTDTIAVDKFLVSNNDQSTVQNTNDPHISRNIPGQDMKVDAAGGTNTSYSTELQPRYDTVGHNPMTADGAAPALNSSLANGEGFLYLAPSALSNKEAHQTGQDQFGILYDNMFEFRSVSDESVIAIEVAGSDNNDGVYDGKHNHTLAKGSFWTANSNESRIDDSFLGILSKSLGVLSLRTGNIDPADQPTRKDVKLDSNTQILIRSGAWSVVIDGGKAYYEETGVGTISNYTLATLPWDIELNYGTEADWVDANDDGIAEYVYIHGTVPGKVTYGLFYYNGYAAQWNGTTGTIAGYLNGEYTTVTFDDYNDFYAVQNSADYKGHLFALQITDGVVSSVMEGVNDKGDFTAATYPSADAEGQRLLWNYKDNTGNNGRNIALYDSAAHTGSWGSEHTHIRTKFADGEDNFGVGKDFGNAYTKDTKAVYYHDTNGNSAVSPATNVSYNWNSRTITVSGGVSDVLYLAADAIIVGDLENLDLRTCDVTMVYEQSKTTLTKSVREIYITTDDSDWTPSGGITPPAVVGTITGTDEAPIPAAVDTFGSPAALNPYFVGMDNKAVTLPSTVTTVTGEGATLSNLMFFPFYANNNTGDARLEVRDSSGNPVWLEYVTGGGLTTGWHAFRIDLTGAHKSATQCTMSGNLAGNPDTYTFYVYYDGSIVSTGNFTVN